MNTTKKALCFRILTIILTLLIWVVGAAVLGFSIYLRVDYWINQYVSASDELTKYTIAVYIFIATGAIILLFGIVGIYGAARPDKCALIVYLVFLPIILGVLIGGGVYGYIYREEIENTVKNSNLLMDIVQKKYGLDRRVTQAIDFMQLELQCCGGTGFKDYKQSVWSTDVIKEVDNRDNLTPLTCCKDARRYEDVQGIGYRYCQMYINYDQGVTDVTNLVVNENIYTRGCGKAFVEFFQENIGIAAAIAFSIVALLVLAIITTALTLVYLRKSPLPREDDVVYEMARTQEKSPYPARGGPYANLYQS